MSSPQLASEKQNISCFVPPDALPSLSVLPWQQPLDLWHEHDVHLVQVKSGLSRHVVRFVESAGHRYAIKETSDSSARREYETYLRLHELGIRTLRPVGYVTRNDGTEIIQTKIGTQPQERQTGYLITELMEKVIPDSFLFKRGFTKENRKRIWDAVIRLFVEMHSSGVYWGDASLANMLINFVNEVEPGLGYRTKLRAVLADAETVEIHRSITDSLRLADVEFFVESMQWMEGDLKASGVVRESVMSEDDQRFIVESYGERYAVEQEVRSFELMTHIDVSSLLGDFDVRGYGKILLKHIYEHKWYLSERQKREVPLVEAAKDWYAEVFLPVCKLFMQHNLPDYFPAKTAARLYVEIMEHKYLLSESEKKDVGIVAATRSFIEKHSTHTPTPMLEQILRELRVLFKRIPAPFHVMYY